MGHIQDMTNEQRLRFLAEKYELTKAARRGTCVSYLNEKSFNDLMQKGYKYYCFDIGKNETTALLEAREMVNEMRENGFYARVVVNPCHNIRGAQTYSVLYRKRK